MKNQPKFIPETRFSAIKPTLVHNSWNDGSDMVIILSSSVREITQFQHKRQL